MISANEDVVDPNSKGARATYSLTNTWYRPYLGTKLLGQKNLVPAGFVQIIDDRLQEVAQGFLKEKAWHELTAAEAKTFGGIAQRMSSERRLILLRGVVLNEATGAFEVYEQNEHVLVLHISLGKKPLPMRRKAIVALLQNKPKEVFVSCSMVE